MAPMSTPPRSVSPAALALLATGGFIVLSALIFLFPFALSPNAIQNDVYMANLFIGAPLLVIGGMLSAASFLFARGQVRLQGWRQALLLSAAGGGLLALLYVFLGGRYSSVGPPANWPPYLNEPMLGVTLGLGLAVFITGWIWGQSVVRLQGQSATPAGR
jgi:hypothetical protein